MIASFIIIFRTKIHVTRALHDTRWIVTSSFSIYVKTINIRTHKRAQVFRINLLILREI